jgi:hypothetical protein
VIVALYSTIWIALILFVAAQCGRRGATTASWVLPVSVTGLALCLIHILIAMTSVHGSHAAAIEATARSTQAVYGLRWGGGLFVNYLFVAVWAVDALRSRPGADRRAENRAVRWALRIFYAIVIFNATVVFARWPMRIVGVCLMIALVLAWRYKITPVTRKDR